MTLNRIKRLSLKEMVKREKTFPLMEVVTEKNLNSNEMSCEL